MNKIDWKQTRDALWEEYLESVRRDPVRVAEDAEQVMHFGEVSMKYGVAVIGERPENGYPLYIAMHGGGQDETHRINEQQWEHMGIYYRDSVRCGIYVNVRGVRDTWDTHGNPESFPLYDRLIENMIAFRGVDPNRVYMMGFSAGGDGVYIVSPRMADRLAAAHMSAGHHNGTSVWNLHNTPIQLQVGMLDGAYGRNKVTVEYQVKLDGMAEKYGGYVHNTFVHVGKPHNFYDNHGDELQTVVADNYQWLADDTYTERKADTDAVHFLDRFTRTALPKSIVWDLSNRAPMRHTESFYWLSAPVSEAGGFVVATLDRERNAVVFGEDTTAVEGLKVLLNDDMLDLDRPVLLVTPSGTEEVRAVRDEAVLRKSIEDRGDVSFAYTAEIKVNL